MTFPAGGEVLTFGVGYRLRVPCCGLREYLYVDYRQNPPPIPPGRHGYGALNQWLREDGEGSVMFCPACDAELPTDPAEVLK